MVTFSLTGVDCVNNVFNGYQWVPRDTNGYQRISMNIDEYIYIYIYGYQWLCTKSLVGDASRRALLVAQAEEPCWWPKPKSIVGDPSRRASLVAQAERALLVAQAEGPCWCPRQKGLAGGSTRKGGP